MLPRIWGEDRPPPIHHTAVSGRYSTGLVNGHAAVVFCSSDAR